MASKKKITTKDVAKYANVSQSAVSMILNQKSNVSFSEETRIKVLNAAKELGYEKKKKKAAQPRVFPKSSLLCVHFCPTIITRSLYIPSQSAPTIMDMSPSSPLL